jgi:hypothetical protein
MDGMPSLLIGDEYFEDCMMLTPGKHSNSHSLLLLGLVDFEARENSKQVEAHLQKSLQDLRSPHQRIRLVAGVHADSRVPPIPNSIGFEHPRHS